MSLSTPFVFLPVLLLVAIAQLILIIGESPIYVQTNTHNERVCIEHTNETGYLLSTTDSANQPLCNWVI